VFIISRIVALDSLIEIFKPELKYRLKATIVPKATSIRNLLDLPLSPLAQRTSSSKLATQSMIFK